MKLSALSTQFFPVQVTAVLDGAAHDPTTDTVEFAFVPPSATPSDADWTAGIWEPPTSTDPTIHTAKILVGPWGGKALPRATYNAWLRVTDNPERPVLKVGKLEIT